MVLEPKGKSAMFIMLDFLIGTHFFKKNIKNFFAFHAGEGSKNYLFTLDESKPLIFFMFLPHLITRFVLKETEKKAGGVNFFHFLRVQNPYVQNLRSKHHMTLQCVNDARWWNNLINQRWSIFKAVIKVLYLDFSLTHWCTEKY